ncbi:hypothetical protein BOX15_Mlig030978g1, partial [Macrostomum lignano]
VIMSFSPGQQPAAGGGLPGAAASNPPPPPTEGLRCSMPGAEAWLGSRRLGTGCLYVAESRLAWFGDGPAQSVGFSLNYPAIGLHGLAKSGGADARSHLYLLVRGDLLGEAGQSGNGADGEEDGDGDDCGDFQDDNEDSETDTEVRFYAPADAPGDALMTVFQAVSDCQALHPDAEDTDSNEEDDEEADDDVDDGNGDGFDYGDENGASIGFPTAGSGDQQPMDTDEQFEDA